MQNNALWLPNLFMYIPSFEEIFFYDFSTWLNLLFHSETVCSRSFRKISFPAGGRDYFFSPYYTPHKLEFRKDPCLKISIIQVSPFSSTVVSAV